KAIARVPVCPSGEQPMDIRGARLATVRIVEDRLPEQTEGHPAFAMFGEAMRVLSEAAIPFAIGGSFAVHYYTRFPATPKDLDLFLFERDVPRAVRELGAAGFDSKVMQEHWLAKARRDGFTVDLIYGSSNFWASVDERWLARARPVRMLGVDSHVIPLEELI